MGKQDTPWQSKGLTPLERKLQSQRDKQMGIFRKKKPEPKKKVRVEEFKFDKGFGMPDFDIKPGQIIKFGRSNGHNEFYWELYKQIIERGLPMPDFDWKVPDDYEIKMRQIQSRISAKYPDIILTVQREAGFDGVAIHIRKRGVGTSNSIIMTGTFLAEASAIDIEKKITTAIGKLDPYFKKEYAGDWTTIETKTPTDEWAEKWAKENS